MIMLKLKYYKFIDTNIRVPVKGGGNYIDRRFIGNAMLNFNPIKKVSQKNLLNNNMNTNITTIPKLKTKKVEHSKNKVIKELKESKHSKHSKKYKPKTKTKGHIKKQSRNNTHKHHKLSTKKN